jgi:hypothetical protein
MLYKKIMPFYCEGIWSLFLAIFPASAIYYMVRREKSYSALYTAPLFVLGFI